MPVRRVVAAVAAAGVLAGCGSASSSGDAGSGPGPGPGTGPSSSSPPATTTSPSTPSASPTMVGSPAHPVVVPARQDPLDWQPVPGSTKDVVTVGGAWTLTVPSGGARARLAGPHPRTIPAGPHAEITDTFLNGSYALVVSEDRLAGSPDVATLVDLATGRATRLDHTSNPPTVVGGTWALGPTTVLHATSGPRRSYCVATVDAATADGTTGWCARPHDGFSRASITDSATTLMTFDHHRPSCRTLVEVTGRTLVPIPGVPDCLGWDSSLDATGAVWSVVANQHRIEAAHFYAHTAAGWYDLGPGVSGSLVTCGRSSYFTRDPQTRSASATLLRWDPGASSLSVAYTSPGAGNAFLAPPRCGGDHLTVTAYSASGDRQVVAAVS